MSGYTDHSHDEPLFREEQRTQEYSPYPNLSNDTTTPTAAAGGHMFGAPPMGDPAEPSSHPDNMTAAASTPNAATAATTPTGFGSNRTMSLGRSPSDKPAGPGVGVGGGGLRRQPSGAYDAATGTSKTDKGLFSGSQQSTPTVNQFNQSPSQPGVAGTVPVGHQPGSPYVQTQDVPATGKSPMNGIVENFRNFATKAEGIAGNVWGHLKVGPSMTDTAWGKMSAGAKLISEGGFEGVYKATFGMDNGEQLRKTYACYLSTSTGPVAGTLYVSNLKFSFCSDRPLSYAPTPGQQAWSYYKVVVPLEKVKEVIPSFNENKPLEKYIQVVTQDGHDFWFMGFVNYDKGVKNMQEALLHIGEIDPNGGLKSPFSGMRSSSHQPNPVGGVPPTTSNNAAPPSYPSTQGAAPTGNPYVKT